MATSSIIHLVFVAIFGVGNGVKIETLNGQWTVAEVTEKFRDVRATVPGGIYSDLMQNSIIGDVFYGYNDTETRWIGQTNWTYSRNFTVNNTVLERDKINIVFEGLDTFASIIINNVPVGNSQNMFRRYIFNIKEALQPGDNVIHVQFASPIHMAQTLASKQGYKIPPTCPPAEYRGECHANQIRKMQASFSWDWGPAFPSMGIWKDVYLEAFNSSRIRYVLANYQDAPNDSWLITLSTYLSAEQGETIKGKLFYWLHTDVAVIEEIVDVDHVNNGTDSEVKVDFSFAIPKLTVRRWWPNGYGDQRLYNLTAQFQSGLEQDLTATTIGFRTIQLIQEPVGSGLSFYFKVNDVPVFAKGANQIPLDVLPERGQDPEKVFRILQSVHDTNMNMLRVWGGGVYESECFYQTADRLGILIWQDFMFACALYPTYPEFLSNVKAEVQHQVKRLYNHPSIAVWAGNNENEVALMTNWYGILNRTTYKSDYIKLYIDTIKAELGNISTSAIFLASSPSNGEESVQEGYLSTNPQNPLYGDVHFYNYIFNSLDVSTYPIPRFASEYGYQSLPDVDTWLTVTDNLTDLDPSSTFMSHRQHHPFGLIENTLLINYQLELNASTTNYYKSYIFYSQIVQALSIKCETEYYRSFTGRLDGSGRGNTMGALFWQLNDVWVAPTWSGIDYTGKWKMLQYFAKNFFATTIVTGFLNTERQLNIYVVCEVPSLVDTSLDVYVVADVYQWNSFNLINSTKFDLSLEFGKSAEVANIDTDNYLANLNCGSITTARKNCFFYLTLYSNDAVIAPSNTILATSLRNSNIQNTTVTIASVLQVDDKGTTFEITINSTGVSLFVWLDSHKILGKFSENGFTQITPTKAVRFQSEEAVTEADLKKILTITHLKDSQYFL